MTRRFDGAITTPADSPDSTRPPPATRPPRPISLEIASAILIVGGFMATVATVATLATSVAVVGGADPGTRLVIGLLIALNMLTVMVGVLVRRGMAWIACINIVAIQLFVEFTAVPGGSATAAVLAALDTFVFIALLRNRAWFDWRPAPQDVPR
jgi:hypothetical protein